jgi:hypothetical protein
VKWVSPSEALGFESVLCDHPVEFLLRYFVAGRLRLLRL